MENEQLLAAKNLLFARYCEYALRRVNIPDSAALQRMYGLREAMDVLEHIYGGHVRFQELSAEDLRRLALEKDRLPLEVVRHAYLGGVIPPLREI